MNSLAPGTAKQYQPLINKWIHYCNKSRDNPFSAPVTSTVLKYLEKMPPLELISLKEMSLKLCILLCLLTAQRDHVLPSLDVTKIQLTEDKCSFVISDIMKTTRLGKHMKPIELKCFPANRELCSVTQIRHFEHDCRHQWGFYQLFISYTPLPRIF